MPSMLPEFMQNLLTVTCCYSVSKEAVPPSCYRCKPVLNMLHM
jgi:hypothetical protein